VDGQVGFGQQPFELGVLCLKLTQPASVGYVHAPALGSPLAESGVAETALAAELLDRQAGLGLLDEPDDLFFGKSALSHISHSP
jgi:hypothetical protein